MTDHTIGIVGLGNMGLPMAQTLARAGAPVAGTDVSAERRAQLPGALGDFAALAGACDVLILSLPSSREVEAVLAEGDGALRAGQLVIDTSTADPASTRALQARLAARRIGFVDAPVSGGAAGAANGQLLVMLGGAADDVARAEPVLTPLARKIVRCGAPGAGNVVKLVNNLLCAAHLALAGEALALADAGGVAPEALLEALGAGSGRSAVTEINLPRWVLNDAYDSGFSMALMRKDVRLAGALADALGKSGAMSAAARALWARSAGAFADGEDFNRMVAWTRDGAK
jgi:3-hydroxyisobutyrate dehydrogenase